MKAEYITPTIEITKFHTDDIITSSGTGTGNGTLNTADIPQIVDADNLFDYN